MNSNWGYRQDSASERNFLKERDYRLASTVIENERPKLNPEALGQIFNEPNIGQEATNRPLRPFIDDGRTLSDRSGLTDLNVLFNPPGCGRDISNVTNQGRQIRRQIVGKVVNSLLDLLGIRQQRNQHGLYSTEQVAPGGPSVRVIDRRPGKHLRVRFKAVWKIGYLVEQQPADDPTVPQTDTDNFVMLLLGNSGRLAGSTPSKKCHEDRDNTNPRANRRTP